MSVVRGGWCVVWCVCAQSFCRIALSRWGAAAAGTTAAIDGRFFSITLSKGSGEGGSYTGAFPGFPSVSADFHQPPLRALSIPGAWVLRSPDLVVVSSFRMHCTFPIWTYRWCDAFNFDPRVLGIQPCHPRGRVDRSLQLTFSEPRFESVTFRLR